MKKQKYESTGNPPATPKRSLILYTTRTIELSHPGQYTRTRSGAIRKIVAKK